VLYYEFKNWFQDVRALDKYWDTLYSLFWPRLQRVIELNVQSVKDCDPQRMKVLDLRPHYVRLPFTYLFVKSFSTIIV
jgi:hypothetical protein